MLDYYYEKLLQVIIFSENPQKYCNDKLLSPMFLSKVKEFLLENSFNYQIQNNLLIIASYCCARGDQELKNEINDIINNCNAKAMSL